MKVRDRELDKYFQVGPKRRVYSSLAQSVEHAAVNRSVVGSSPTGGVVGNECSEKFNNWLHGQAVKTPPFHGGNRGSNPLGVTKAP